MLLKVIFVVIGFILLIKGADFLVDGASVVAKKFHIPVIIIGLTIVAIGTSMPELIVSATSALKGYSDISIGNVVGSNIANLFCILGICSVIRPLKFKRQTRLYENWIAVVSTFILFALANNSTDFIISRKEGIFLLACAVLFIIYNIVMSKVGIKFDEKVGEKEEEIIADMPIWKAIIYILLGIIALKFGGDLVVDGCQAIAQMIGISDKLISLTVIAFSTSLPELITSVIATKKGETDMAIGNILGSQIFNILLIIGLSATLTPIKYSISYNKDILLLLMGTILFALYPYIGEKNKMTRNNGIAFLIIYAFYMISLVINNL